MNKLSSTAAAFALSMALTIPVAAAPAQEAVGGAEPGDAGVPVEQGVAPESGAVEAITVPETEATPVDTENASLNADEGDAPAAGENAERVDPADPAEPTQGGAEPAEGSSDEPGGVNGSTAHGSTADGAPADGTASETGSAPAGDNRPEADSPAIPETPAAQTSAAPAASGADTGKTSKEDVTSDKEDVTSDADAVKAGDAATDAATDTDAEVAVPLEGAVGTPSLAYDAVSASVTVRASGVACATGVEFVSACLTSPSGAQTWVRLASEGANAWAASVPAASLGWEKGSWAVSLVVCDSAWAGVEAGSAACALDFGEAVATPSLSYDPATASVTVAAADVSCTSGVEFVSARLVSPSGAVTWLRLESVGRGDWAASVPAASLGWEQGVWTVGLTVCDAAWRGVDAGTSPCTLVFGKASATPSLAYDPATASVAVTATGAACSTGVEFVSAKLTSPTGSQTWLRLADMGGGVWSASVPAADLGWEGGAWTVETYVCDEMWRAVEGGRTSSTLSFSAGGETLWTQSGAVAGHVVVHVSGGVVEGARNVAFFVAGLDGANSWHQAVEQPDGSWAAALSEHDLSADGGWVQAVASVDGSTRYLSAVPFSIGDADVDFDRLSTSVTDAKGNDASIVGTMLDGTVYVFLPSNADPSSFSLSLVAGGASPTVYVSGDLISGFTAHGSGDAIDLTDGTFAQDASGSYELYVKANDYARATRVYVMRSAGLKSLYIVSNDPDEQGREYVEGSEDHSAKATGTMSLVNADGTVVYDGKLKQVKGRGNSTWQGAKKPYQVKLGSSASLVTGDNEDKSKTWVLLANYYDPSLMRNYIAYTLAKALGLSDSPDCENVDLYYDGEYRGTYLLSEKVQIGGGRVDITDLEELNGSLDGEALEDHPTEQGVNAYGNEYQYVTGVKEPGDISGGYLLEIDNGYYGTERSWFKSTIGSVVVKSPEDSSQGEVRYISEYFQEAVNEGSKTDGDLGRYFDLSSLAKSFLVQSLAKNADYMKYSSTFFYKDAGNDLIYSGPVWDFDTAYGNHKADESYDYTDPEGFGQEEDSFFFYNTQFRATVQKVFAEVFAPLVESTLLSDKGGTEELGSVDSIASGLGASEAMNEKVWGFGQAGFSIEPKGTYEENVSTLKTWLSERYTWMKSAISSSGWLA